jgi:hypothetical protein
MHMPGFLSSHHTPWLQEARRGLETCFTSALDHVQSPSEVFNLIPCIPDTSLIIFIYLLSQEPPSSLVANSISSLCFRIQLSLPFNLNISHWWFPNLLITELFIYLFLPSFTPVY